MVTVKVNWSGGKDSTYASYLHLMEGHYVKMVCYIPMFTSVIPLLRKSLYEWLLCTADWFRYLGCSVYFVNGITYYDYVTRVVTRGDRKGKLMGFPYIDHCGFKRDSKIKALKSFDCGYYNYEDVGIAYDEPDRYGTLNYFRRSILVEKEKDENTAFYVCRKLGLLSPSYDTSFRDGCVLCYNSSALERSLWFRDYPEAYNILRDLQNIVIEDGGCPPLRNYEYFIDPLQLSIFD